MQLLPVGKKKKQKLVIGDDSGEVVCFEMKKGEAQPVLDLLDEMTAKRIKLEEPALRALVNWGIAAGDLSLLQSALVAARKNGAVKSYAAPSAKLAAKPSGAAAQSLAPAKRRGRPPSGAKARAVASPPSWPRRVCVGRLERTSHSLMVWSEPALASTWASVSQPPAASAVVHVK